MVANADYYVEIFEGRTDGFERCDRPSGLGKTDCEGAKKARCNSIFIIKMSAKTNYGVRCDDTIR